VRSGGSVEARKKAGRRAAAGSGGEKNSTLSTYANLVYFKAYQFGLFGSGLM
jgi:hypothetical protein